MKRILIEAIQKGNAEETIKQYLPTIYWQYETMALIGSRNIHHASENKGRLIKKNQWLLGFISNSYMSVLTYFKEPRISLIYDVGLLKEIVCNKTIYRIHKKSDAYHPIEFIIETVNDKDTGNH